MNLKPVGLKNPKHLPAQCVLHGAEGRALIAFTGRCGFLRWFELLVAGLAAAAVNAVVLIWKLARMNILTMRD